MENKFMKTNKGKATNLLINDSKEINNIFKLELEQRRLTLRKEKINNIIFTKRNAFNDALNNLDETKNNYKLEITDINIPDQYKIDIPAFHNNVNIIYIIINETFFFYSLIYRF